MCLYVFVYVCVSISSVRAHARMRGDPRALRRERELSCCYCYASSRRLVGRRGYVAKIIAPVSRVSLREHAEVGACRTRCANLPSVSPSRFLVPLSFTPLFVSLTHSLLSACYTHSPSFSLSVIRRTGTTFVPCVTGNGIYG